MKLTKDDAQKLLGQADLYSKGYQAGFNAGYQAALETILTSQAKGENSGKESATVEADPVTASASK